MSPQPSHCALRHVARLDETEVACIDCGLDPMCTVLDYGEKGSGIPESVLLRRRKVRAGEVLFRAGQPFDAIYAVKSGSFKSLVAEPHSGNRVVGFYFPGELVGVEGMADQRYACTVRALEPGQVCVLHLEHLKLAPRPPLLIQQALIEMLSREVAVNQQLMAALVRQNAEQRVAAFLLSLSERLSRRGFDADLFNLRMSRGDIGSYLGLARETVSRLLTRFQHQGFIRLRHKQMQLMDDDQLRLIATDY
jgi:CRP/FNR family transcriptional regulator